MMELFKATVVLMRSLFQGRRIRSRMLAIPNMSMMAPKPRLPMKMSDITGICNRKLSRKAGSYRLSVKSVNPALLNAEME